MEGRKLIKCVVWDLDNTLWKGTLLEGDELVLNEAAVEIIKKSDRRGILHSVSSRNDHDMAMAALQRFGLTEYFLYPKIHWEPKSTSLRSLAADLNLGLDSFAFVDDTLREREEVRHHLPEVRCFDATEIGTLSVALDEATVSMESAGRRQLYQEGIRREEFKMSFKGGDGAFLQSLQLELSIFPTTEQDLDRASELTMRTHQLNSTGRIYSKEDLTKLIRSPNHAILSARLKDRFGSFGTIGLAVVEMTGGICWLRLLLTSCRVIPCGVGSIFLAYLLRMAKARGMEFRSEFVKTERNRMMYVAYRFGGFHVLSSAGEEEVLGHDLVNLPAIPSHVSIDASAVEAVGVELARIF
jgi:FkbH-like protein